MGAHSSKHGDPLHQSHSPHHLPPQQQQQQHGSLHKSASAGLEEPALPSLQPLTLDVPTWVPQQPVLPFSPTDAVPNRRLKRRAPSSTTSSSSVASSNETDPIQNPDTVSLRDFEVLRNIGRGSHGTIYLVRHRETNKLYAMKTLRKAEVLRKKEFDHTFTELSVLKRLAAEGDRCPYIVPLRYAFHSLTRLFLVFEYCPGGELYFHLGRRGRLPEHIAKFYAAEISVSLGYLHACGIAFRDLKPENLMLDALGHINLIDFGLCKEGIRSGLTGITSCSGTTEYLAPEILLGKGGGLGVDWWAFGMILYEMLVGVPPWYDQEREKVVQGVLHAELEFPQGLVISNDARSLITGLLMKDPTQRIGCRGSGASEIITHPFFKGIDWLKIARRAVEPPFVPPIMEEGAEGFPGICNFDREYTSIVLASPPAKDYLSPQPGDSFDGFYFDFRMPRNT